MAIEPDSNSVPIKCNGCGKTVIVPSGKVMATMRAGNRYVVYCSRRCQQRHIAPEMKRQLEENARYSDPVSGQ